MPHTASTRTALPHRRKSVPPLPHPSWSHGRDYAREGRPISADDFWTRLGI